MDQNEAKYAVLSAVSVTRQRVMIAKEIITRRVAGGSASSEQLAQAVVKASLAAERCSPTNVSKARDSGHATRSGQLAQTAISGHWPTPGVGLLKTARSRSLPLRECELSILT